jgi:hypothetical protein
MCATQSNHQIFVNIDLERHSDLDINVKVTRLFWFTDYKRTMTTAQDQQSIDKRKEDAQVYLASHHIKELYAKLVYEATLYRVNEPLEYFRSRLEDFAQHGLTHERSYPRIIFIIGETREIQAYCYRQLCEKFRMTYVKYVHIFVTNFSVFQKIFKLTVH